MFRCPTCVAVLTDQHARRCPMCGANLRRHPPVVLGQSERLTARLHAIDLRPVAVSPGEALEDVDIDLTAEPTAGADETAAATTVSSDRPGSGEA